MSFEVITPPAKLFDAGDFGTLKTHVEVEEADEEWDALILGYARAAQSKAESYMRQLILTQTIRVYADGFRSLSLSPGPVQSVDKVEYLDDSGNWIEVAAATYRALTLDSPGYLALVPGASWPTPSPQPQNVRATITVGMGSGRDEIDDTILQAIQLLTAYFLENRGDKMKLSEKGMHPGAEFLLSDHRVWF
ncbi:MAG: hypothetical protein AB3N24_07315 [Leisingera sp.]